MDKLIGFFFDKDGSNHWYFIPESLRSRWDELDDMLASSDEEVINEAENLINDEFSKYMCTRNINEYTVIEL